MTTEREREHNVTVGIDVEGVEKLQDTADILSEVMPSITIRNNQNVTFHLSLYMDKSIHHEEPDVMLPGR